MHTTKIVQLRPSKVSGFVGVGISDPRFPMMFVTVIEGIDHDREAKDAVRKAFEVLELTEMIDTNDTYEASVWAFTDLGRGAYHQFNPEETAKLRGS